MWDGTALAWVDLDSDVTTMPAGINGGVILPAAQGEERNGLFEGGRGNGWAGGVGIGPGGDGDKHANTLWLRSPQFVLDASGNLNVTLFGGSPRGAAPTSAAAIPSAAANESAWMGVALRRVSDGVFLLTKVQPEPGSTVVTLTQAQLAPYVGVSCTLDLINMDKGGWGWTGMNRVVIPGSIIIPTADAGNSTVTAGPTTVASDKLTASTVTVTVKDASGNPIAGKDVSLARSEGTGTGTPVITPLVGTSNGSGVATFVVTCNTVGEYVFTATVDGLELTAKTVTVTFTVGAVSAAQSTVAASPVSVTANGTSTSTITVTLKDAYGNPVAGKDVSVATTSGPVIAPTSTTTDVSGVAAFAVTSTTVGEFVFTATGDGVPLTPTATVTFTQPPATITWGGATDVTLPPSAAGELNGTTTGFVASDVLDNGMFVAAVTNGTGGTVNGVIFTGRSSFTANRYHTFGTSTISMDYGTGGGNVSNAYSNFGYSDGTSMPLLLNGGGQSSGTGTITLGSLIAGRQYQIQVWATTWNDIHSMTVGGVTLRVHQPQWWQGPGAYSVPQYVVGTFTANATSQTISWSGGFTPSAISLRDLTGVATSNYASWAGSHGLTDPTNPNHVGPDGLTNLLDYALDLKTDGTNGSPGTLTGNVLSFTKRPDAVTNNDVTYAIEISADLGVADPWTTTTGVTDNSTAISIDLSTLSGSTHFARLVVTQKL